MSVHQPHLSAQSLPLALRRAYTLTGIRAAKKLLQHRPQPDYGWTILNRETEERYKTCLENGGHAPSGGVVERVGYMTPLLVCVRCEVPYTASKAKPPKGQKR